jgi:signal transduction histidine kinase
MSRRLSLEVKLPLLMSVILAAVLAASIIATITTIRTSARLLAGERVRRAVHEIVTVGTTNLAATSARYRALANDSALQRALEAQGAIRPGSPGARAVRAALAAMTLPTDSGMPIELWTARGVRVAVVGNDIRPAAPAGAMSVRTELPEEVASQANTGDTSSSARFTALYPDGDRVHFWLIMPVKRANETIGYIAHQRRLAVGPQTQRTLRELSGDSISLYYRNIDGRFWASENGRATVPLLQEVDSTEGTARLASGDAVLFNEERFATTPIVVGMYLPERALYVGSKRTIETLMLLSVALLAIGTLAAWLIGRSVARPLGEFTRATAALATGDFAARVPEGRDLETRRLADSFNHMAQELGSSRAALERQTQEAQSANRAKSEFLTTMSHELRTPLNAIGGYVDLLDMGLRGPITEEQRRDLMRIKASQEHLLGLISGVLDLSRIEAGRVTYTFVHIQVDAFLRGMDALVAPQAAAKQVAIEHMPSGPQLAVVADREKLRQVLLNLLSNAIRHTPAGGTVTLSADDRAKRVAIMVDDTGPGIPPERREHVFEPFVQLDRSLTQSREGLGLGLAISRDLARGMAGDLFASERPGGGARFVVLLPKGDSKRSERTVYSGEVPVGGTSSQ